MHSTPVSNCQLACADPPWLLPACALQPCGGAIPLCMVQEFDLPMEIIDRKVGFDILGYFSTSRRSLLTAYTQHNAPHP